MIHAYELSAGRLTAVGADAAGVLWWDLVHPSREEEKALEDRLGLELPTKDEMHEIEISSRLYSEDGGHFMTALIPANTDGDDPVMAPITFILVGHRLVTIRYTEPRAFTAFPQRAEKSALGLGDGETVLLGLFEAIVDRLADVLERAGREIDAISHLEPVISMLERDGSIRVVVDTRTEEGTRALFGGSNPAAVLYTKNDFIEKNPNTTQALVDALVKSLKWIAQAKPEEIAAVVPEEFLLGDKALYMLAVEKSKPSYSQTGVIDPAGMKSTNDMLVQFDADMKDAKVDLAKTFVDRFAKKAAETVK